MLGIVFTGGESPSQSVIRGALDGKDWTSMNSGPLSGTVESLQGKAEDFIRSCLSDTPNLFYAGF